MDLTVVLPVYNEKQNIQPLTKEIRTSLEGECDFTVLYVNDGSTDGSTDVLNELAGEYSGVDVIHFSGNAGQSAAFAAGFREAETPLVATMDADRQNDPADLPKLLEALDDYDVVAGYRENREDNWLRKVGSRLANNVRNAVTGDDIVDTGCSLKLFRRQVLEDIPYFEGMHRFFPTLARREGYTVTQVPTNHRPRMEGETKYTLTGRLMTTVSDLLAVRWLLDRSLDYEIEDSDPTDRE